MDYENWATITSHWQNNTYPGDGATILNSDVIPNVRINDSNTRSCASEAYNDDKLHLIMDLLQTNLAITANNTAGDCGSGGIVTADDRMAADDNFLLQYTIP